MPASAALVCPICQARYQGETLKFCRADGAELQPAAARGSRWLGCTLGERYEVLRFLGAGGMAEVYEARRLDDEHRVALKLMHPQMSADPVAVERFEQEARLIGMLDHPNVVAVYDSGVFDEGPLFMAMELLDGESLEELLLRGPVDLATIVEVTRQASAGIQAAHDKQVVHRDIKPANIFLHRPGAGEPPVVKVAVKLLDLGVAKLNSERATNLTATGMIFGSPDYMSPEQALGRPVDHRADIYSFGVVLFHALTGLVPFVADSYVGVLTQQVTAAPQWPGNAAELPEALRAVVLKALEKNPDNRFASIGELERALSEVCEPLIEQAAARAAAAAAASAAAEPRDIAAQAQPNVGLVALPDAGEDADDNVVEVAPDIFWVGRREGVVLERNVYLRVYRGNDLQINVLIDPGPPKDLSTVRAKVGSLVGGLEKVDLVFLNHQDADVAANSAFVQAVNPQAHVICSEDTWRLVHFFGLRPKGYSACEHFRDLRMPLATGHEVQFVPSPYCHFRGAVMYYDRDARVLFSGDLFGGISANTKLVADDEALAGIEIFHQLYMPSHRALAYAVERVRALDPPPLLIAPQHGGVIEGELIERVLSMVESLHVGVDLLEDRHAVTSYVAAINRLVDALVSRFGERWVAEQLACFSADGTFPNLFVFEGPLRVADIKIEPRAALQALVEHARAELGEQRGELDALLAEALDERLLGALTMLDT